MPTDFENLKKLVPEQRVQELKKLINKLREEVEEKERDIQQAEQLLTLAHEEHQALRKIRRDERKTTLEEKTQPEEQTGTLEETAAEAPRIDTELEQLLQTRPPTGDDLWYRQIAQQPIQDMYQELRTIYNREAATGIETDADRERIYKLRRGIEAKKHDIETGEYKASAKAKHLLTAAEEMAENMYKGTAQESYH